MLNCLGVALGLSSKPASFHHPHLCLHVFLSLLFCPQSRFQLLFSGVVMSSSKRSVLITGCSDGGLGAALAIAFHEAGLKVYATTRDWSKMSQLASLGIELLTLDILSESSIADCVGKLSSLDILVNNAGSQYLMPVSDISIVEGKKLFDLNVWAHIAVTQAFLPLLRSSDSGLIVNHTSISACTTVPFSSVYNASKAALAMFSDTLRLELQPFGINVVDLRTGLVRSNLIDNTRRIQGTSEDLLPKDSIFQPAKNVVEKILRMDSFAGQGTPRDTWANGVVGDLLKARPPNVIWRGENAWLARIATMLPFGTFDGFVKKLAGLDLVAKVIREKQADTE